MSLKDQIKQISKLPVRVIDSTPFDEDEDGTIDVPAKDDKDGDGITDRLPVISQKAIEYYHSLFEEDITFWTRFKRFLTAQNEAGRIAKSIKDFALIFTPYGRRIRNVTEFISEQIITTDEEKAMETVRRKSKTVIIFGLLFIVGLLQLLGIDLGFGLELSTDAEWVLVGSSVVGVILRLITSKPVEWKNIIELLTGGRVAADK